MRHLTILSIVFLLSSQYIYSQKTKAVPVMQVESMIYNFPVKEQTIGFYLGNDSLFIQSNDGNKAIILDSIFTFSNCVEILRRKQNIPKGTLPMVINTSFLKNLRTDEFIVQIEFHLIKKEEEYNP